ncbi:MAG: hypothetical protein CMJ18_21410 [Phycisphaeraceae bacterium]|nr:hypothetical protein [Phycisphaeraceae bacterium]
MPLSNVVTTLMNSSRSTRLRRGLDRLRNRTRISTVRVVEPGASARTSPIDELRVRFAGRTVRVRVRRDTTDIDLVRMILQDDGEYRLPPEVEPQIIFDVGANIGVTAIYFAAMYPDAEIWCFEPLSENVRLLEANARLAGDRVHVVPYGLSDVAGLFPYRMSDEVRSFAGGTFRDEGGDPSRRMMLPLGTVADAMAHAGVDRVDVFKIDTEGSEWPILRSIPEPVRRSAQAFIGELHGNEDWAFCELLARTHALGIEKRYQRRCYPFVAVRRDLARQEEFGVPVTADRR